MISLASTSYAALLLCAEILLCVLILKSDRLKEWAEVLCFGLFGAFIHFVLLQGGNVRAEEWEILSAFVFVLGLSFVGWSASRAEAQPALLQGYAGQVNLSNSDEIRDVNVCIHDERLKMVGILSTRIAQEIRKPLSGMMMSLEEMRRFGTELNEKTLEKSIQRMEGQVEHLLHLSRALNDLLSLDGQDDEGFVILSDVFSLAKELCDPWIQQEGIEFRWPFKIPNIEVSGGSAAHAQILLNLIKNAVDVVSVLPTGGVRWIAVDVVECGGEVKITIDHAGSPIERKVQRILFSPFLKSRRTGHRLGLELSSCWQLVNSLGGEIWYDESAPHPRFVLRYSCLPCVRDLVSDQAAQSMELVIQKIA